MLLLRRDDIATQEILKGLVSGDQYGDLVFITADGKCVSDKVLVFHYFPIMQTFQCEKCENSHDQTVLMITHVKTDHLKNALYQLCTFGNAQLLSDILNIPLSQSRNLFDQTTLAIGPSQNETNYESMPEDMSIGKPSFESTQVNFYFDFSGWKC